MAETTGFRSGDNVPYAPPGTIIEVLRRYRDRGLPSPVTTEVLERAGVPETLSGRTLSSLKLLGFLDSEGVPAPEFDAANRAPEESYKERLQQLILNKYTEVVTFADPATDPYEKVRDAFRGYNPLGQQDRMVTLFLGLMDYTGVDISAAVSSRKPQESRGTPRGNGGSRTPQLAKKGAAQATTSRTPRSKAPETSPGVAALPPALIGLLQQIPTDGKGWTEERRKAFMVAFEAVLDYTVPAVQEEYPVPQVDDPEVSTS